MPNKTEIALIDISSIDDKVFHKKRKKVFNILDNKIKIITSLSKQ